MAKYINVQQYFLFNYMCTAVDWKKVLTYTIQGDGMGHFGWKKPVLGKCVPLVRSCVLAYVRTAFLGTQERRNAKFFKGTQVRGTHHPKF